jgi:hypothetical protein
MTLKHDGKKWPRMTEMLSEADNPSHGLMPWVAKCAVEWIKENCDNTFEGLVCVPEHGYCLDNSDLEESKTHYKTVSQEALDIGSAIHEAIEDTLHKKTLKGWPENFTDTQINQAANTLVGFFKWYAEHELETIETELRLWADDWCGQLDWYGVFDGKFYIIDWKTSKSLYHKDRIQVAGYRRELGRQGMIVEGHGVLRLDKETGAFEWRDYSKFYEKDLEEFQLIHDLYMLRHPIIRAQFEDKNDK